MSPYKVLFTNLILVLDLKTCLFKVCRILFIVLEKCFIFNKKLLLKPVPKTCSGDEEDSYFRNKERNTGKHRKAGWWTDR